jgi:hypothetical protein
MYTLRLPDLGAGALQDWFGAVTWLTSSGRKGPGAETIPDCGIGDSDTTYDPCNAAPSVGAMLTAT